MSKSKKPTPIKAAAASDGAVREKISADHLKVHLKMIERVDRANKLEQEAQRTIQEVGALRASVGAWMQDMQAIYGLGESDGIDKDGVILR